MLITSIGSTPKASQKTSAPTSLREIEISGNTILHDEIGKIKKEIKEKFRQEFDGRMVSGEKVGEIKTEITKRINELYIQHNYLTSRAIPEDVSNGIVKIAILEGELADIEIENKGELWLRSSYVQKRIRQGAGKPLSFDRLESQLRLLRMNPLVDHVEASLKPTGKRGKSDLSVRVKETPRVYLKFSSDNYSSPTIGSERYGVDFALRNPTSLGDQLAGSYYRTTTGGGKLLDGNYVLPLNPMNGALMLRGARYKTKITDSDFDDLDIEGEKDLVEIRYRQPLIRTYSNEFALSVGFTYQDGQTFVFEDIGTPFGLGPDEDGSSRTCVVKFGQDYIQRGPTRAWSIGSQFNIGTGLFNATSNPSPIPDGKFFSWLGNGQFGQRLAEKHLLIMQAAVQLSGDGLLASEQFVIGGGQSVRGYRQNMRIGDNGFRLSIEDRMTLYKDMAGRSVLEVRPFVDMGATWNVSDNPNEQQSQRFLIGAGLGVWASLGRLWEPLRDFWFKVDYGYPFIDLDDKGNNAQDKGFYFSVNYEPNKIIEKLFQPATNSKEK
jgi:hemolysin activation/secretion protein